MTQGEENMTSIHFASIGARCARTAITFALLASTQLAAMAQTVANVTVGQQVVLTQDTSTSTQLPLQLVSASSQITFGAGRFAIPNSGAPAPGGAVGAFGANQLQVGGADGMTVAESFTTKSGVNYGLPFRSSIQTSGAAGLDMVTDGPDAGDFRSLNLTGGFTLTGVYLQNFSTGGELQISRIRLDLAAGHVLADLNGTRAERFDDWGELDPAVNYNSNDTILWTFSPSTDVVGPTALDVSAVSQQNFVAAVKVKNLAITPAGLQFFVDSLGLAPLGESFINNVNRDTGKWGSIDVALAFTPAIPEPSTYALMGLVLVGVSLAARRQTNARQAT